MKFNVDSNILYSFLGGVFLIVFVLARKWNDNKMFSISVETNGLVIDEELEKGIEGNEYYYPVVKFKTTEGEWITSKSRDGYYPQKYAVKKEVKIQYSLEDHTQFKIKGADTIIHLIFLLCAAMLILYSVYAYLTIIIPS
ncbi:DUF3592 domain-containing protein [Mucilaginibacter polytrichastri]|uniref:DUF3592 domain-containing protein n=1 Tax=Mucilaginibacter polytrichastri TaxID=1302689 RepID=A0A1Q5ZUR7_9SPHI|nr:DUF3592 domain-containing protein [Mucilaginibacter polytrichastri]OKS85522.1 hypothetical protein RG47T_0968 [Mucilaginibacter polytrichastri]SFS37320.1 hypothetical protein SAMN04487890_101132 [Mucilaginibacter polytrichastri]